MPVYEFTGPDGRTYEITGPEGSTPEQAFSMLQQQLGQPKPEAPSGFAQGVKDVLNAPAQLLERGLGAAGLGGVASGMNLANNWIRENVPGLGWLEQLPETERGLSENISAAERDYQARRALAGEGGFDWGRLGGNVVAGLPLGGGGGMLARGSGVLARTGAAGVGGAVAAPLMTPVVDESEDSFWKQKAEQAGLGAFTGVALGGPLAALGRGRELARRPEVETLQRSGVNPTIGQLAGNTASRFEEKLASVPMAGDYIAGGRREALEQFNRGAMNEALATIGGSVDRSGRDAIASMQAQGGAAFDQAASLLPQGLRMSPTGGQRMTDLAQDMRFASRGAEDEFWRFVNNLQGRKISPSGHMSAEDFAFIQSKLSERINSTADPELRKVFGDFREILQDEAASAAPDYKRALDRAREAWAGVKRIERAANYAPTQEGVFTPGQLLRAEKGADKGGSRFARGGGLLQDYAQAGQNVLGDRVPNSGTTDRALAAGLIGGGAAMINPVLAVVSLLGLGSTKALYSDTGRRLAAQALRNMPNLPPEIVSVLAGAAGESEGGF